MHDEIRRVVATQLKVHESEIGLDDDLWDRGMSSLTSVAVMLAVEETFHVQFPNDVLTRDTFSSVRRIADAVASSAAHPAVGG